MGFIFKSSSRFVHFFEKKEANKPLCIGNSKLCVNPEINSIFISLIFYYIFQLQPSTSFYTSILAIRSLLEKKIDEIAGHYG